jgi:carbon monoxide dehydrogenase subunit G
MDLTVSIDIQAPVDRVWQAITDIEHAKDRITSIEAIEVLERPASGLVGFKWRETRTMFGKQATEVMWVTAETPGRSYDVRAESHGAIYRSTMAVEPSAGGTRLSFTFGAEPVSFGARVMTVLLGWMMAGATRKALRKDLEDIKASVER